MVRKDNQERRQKTKQNKTRIGKLIRAARKLSTDCKAQVFRMRICCPRRPISISPQENFTLAAASAHLHISKGIILLSVQGTRDKRKEAKPGSSPLCFVQEIRDSYIFTCLNISNNPEVTQGYQLSKLKDRFHRTPTFIED